MRNLSYRLRAIPLALLLSAPLPALQVQAQSIDNVAPSDAEADQNATSNQSLSLDELQMFADVFNQIRKGYVKEVDDSTLFEYAVKGMLTGLDPHSAYLSEDDYSDLQTTTQGEFSGLGIEIGREGGYIKIIAPIDGSPAEAAGLQSGDVILKLNGVSAKGLSLDESVGMMRGEKGSAIELEIGRPGTPLPFDVTVVRDVIKVASVRSRILTPGYGYLRIAQFQGNTGGEVIAAISSLQAEGQLNGLVIDLRNNPGGVLNASVDVAGAVLDGGLVVYTEGRHPGAAERFEAEAGDMLDGAPVVVLINGGSASASEIVAGALQDLGRAVVMGTRSFGKGSVQTVLPVSESRAVKLTTALYFTPNGRSIQADGIVPDIVVERAKVTSMESNRTLKEADLAGRLDSATGEKADTKSEQLAGLREQDNQLYEALTLLRGVNLLHKRPVMTDTGAAQTSNENP